MSRWLVGPSSNSTSGFCNSSLASASHVSKEPAAHLVLDELGKEAVLHADMCLGEGTGAIALCPFLDMGATLYNTLSTFDDIHVDQYEELN